MLRGKRKQARVFFIPFVGGPCAGKSKGLTYVARKLRELGYICIIIPESPTMIFGAGLDPMDFQDPESRYLIQCAIFATQLGHEEQFLPLAEYLSILYGKTVILLSDRALFDGLGYIDFSKFVSILKQSNISRLERLYKYHGVVDLVSAADGAEDSYSNKSNKCRSEDAPLARRFDVGTLEGYLGHPNMTIVHNIENEQTISFRKKKMRMLEAVLAMIPDSNSSAMPMRYELLEFSKYMLENTGHPFVVQEVTRTTTRKGTVFEKITSRNDYKPETIYRRGIQVVSKSEYQKYINQKNSTVEENIRYSFVHDERYLNVDVNKKQSILEFKIRMYLC